MSTEIVRLPVPEDGVEPLLSHLSGQAYFAQEGLLSHRVFRGADRPEVMLMLEWESRDAAHHAFESEVGQSFVSSLSPMLAGAPDLAFYDSQG
jgi:quinol monooxygenase YgiN